MNAQTFDLLMEHLREIKQQNATQIEMMVKQNEKQDLIMATHIAEDSKVHRVVERHSVYWSTLSLGIPTALAYLTKKLGWY